MTVTCVLFSFRLCFWYDRVLEVKGEIRPSLSHLNLLLVLHLVSLEVVTLATSHFVQ